MASAPQEPMFTEENKNLGHCRDCGSLVSINAPTCPKCGAKNPARGKSRAGKLFLILIGLALLLKAVELISPATTGVPENKQAVSEERGGTPDSQEAALLKEALPWKQITANTHGFLGDDGGGADTATVCDTPEHHRAWLQDNNKNGCKSFIHGLPITILKVLPPDPVKDNFGGVLDGMLLPLAQISIPSKKYRGYVQLFAATHPDIPAGVTVLLKRDSDDPILLTPSQNANLMDGVSLGNKATAKLIKYDPATGSRDLYVSIMGGEHDGKTGWVFSNDATSEDGRIFDAFDGALIDQHAKKASLPTTTDATDNKQGVLHSDVSDLIEEAEKVYASAKNVYGLAPKSTTRDSLSPYPEEERRFHVLEHDLKEKISAHHTPNGYFNTPTMPHYIGESLVRLEQFNNFVFDAVLSINSCKLKDAHTNLKIARGLLNHAKLSFEGKRDLDWDPPELAQNNPPDVSDCYIHVK